MIRFFLFFLGVASSHAALTNSYQKTVNLLQGHGIEFDSATAQKAAISAYVKEIDPHAKYLSNEESNILLGAQTGQFYYLGCSLTFSNAVPEIAAVVESSPAANSGLKVGHIIQRINGLDLAGLRFAEVLDRLRIFDSKALELKVLDGETETKLVVTPQEIRPVSIQKIEINKRGKVRRARIYYFRNLTGKRARIQEKRG